MNEDQKPPSDIKILNTPCDSSCGCHATGTPGKMRSVLEVIVLIAAGTLVARAVIKTNGATASTPAEGYATTAIIEQPSAPVSTATDTVVVKEIGALSELNVVATNMPGGFVFVPGKNEPNTNVPTAQIQGAAQTIEPKLHGKIGLFTLKTDSSDYAKLAVQMPLPGVLTLVKGHGMSAIS